MQDNHCGRLGCFCTHTNGCEKGYIFIRYKDTKVIKRNGEEIITDTWYDGVKFCTNCDAQRAHIQNTSASSEEFGQRLRDRSKHKSAENYDNQEASKTRTL